MFNRHAAREHLPYLCTFAKDQRQRYVIWLKAFFLRRRTRYQNCLTCTASLIGVTRDFEIFARRINLVAYTVGPVAANLVNSMLNCDLRCTGLITPRPNEAHGVSQLRHHRQQSDSTSDRMFSTFLTLPTTEPTTAKKMNMYTPGSHTACQSSEIRHKRPLVLFNVELPQLT